MDQNEIEVVLLGNAGALLTANGVKLLIDGLYRDHSGLFSNVPDSIWKDLRKGQGRYGNINYVLFSHGHPDHLDSGRAMLFLACHAPELVILPEEGGGETSALIGYLKGSSIPHALLSVPALVQYQAPDLAQTPALASAPAQTPVPTLTLAPVLAPAQTPVSTPILAPAREQTFSLKNGVFVTAFPTVHMGSRYASVSHFSYLISVGKKRILFLADAGFDESCFRLLKDQTVHCVFVTPLFFHNKAGQDILRRILRPKRVVIYHLPFEGEDPNGYLKMASRDRERYRREGLAVDLFCEAEQALIL